MAKKGAKNDLTKNAFTQNAQLYSVQLHSCTSRSYFLVYYLLWSTAVNCVFFLSENSNESWWERAHLTWPEKRLPNRFFRVLYKGCVKNLICHNFLSDQHFLKIYEDIDVFITEYHVQFQFNNSTHHGVIYILLLGLKC